MRRKYFAVVFSILTLLVAAQSAVASYAVYVDSVQAGPGEDVAVRFYLTNEKALTSLSVPIAYDPAIVTLKSISFSGSRAQHLANKLVKPSDLSTANGHFMVAAFQWLEDPIAVGDGLLFTAMFNVNSGATSGSSTLLDTLFYSPGGYLEVTRVDTPGGIRPEFRRGRILVGEINRAPIFTIIPDQYVLEGDSLKLTVQVTDPNNDYITIAATSKPLGALFQDNGNGTASFVWTPAYVGPNSADGSPVKVRFWAGDGDLSSQMDVTVHVINCNRRPQITAPTTVAVEAGETLDFSLSAIDPDFEAVYWSWSGLPHGATFDAANPGKLTWSSAVTDTGSYTLQFVATDTQGLADTALVSTSVQAVALYTLKLDSVVALLGETMSYNVVLDNKLPVSGFNLLIHYDPTVLTYLSLTNTGTRAASFEYYTVTRNYNSIAGDLRIVGLADLDGSTSALAAGEGSIALGQFRVSGDLDYAGMSVPLWFAFHDTPVNDDNTLTNESGIQIEQSEIVYVNGNIQIQDIGDVKIGDINLNNIAAEIGDVIYFTNFFVNPRLYKFTLLQYANSDINQDGMTATVADLVSLINWVVSGTQPFTKVSSGSAATEATLETATALGAVTFSSECSSDIGAAYVVIETAQELTPDMLTVKVNNMTVDLRQDDGEVKVLLYSLDGDVVPSGRSELFTIAGLTDFKVAHVELGSTDGRYLEVSTAAAVELPTGYELSQNYPNPFNPETTIEFSLPSASQVELMVLNVLGQQVVTLVNGDCTPGVHRVVWDGKDGNGRAVASGIYLYRLSTGSTIMTRKMMLLK